MNGNTTIIVILFSCILTSFYITNTLRQVNAQSNVFSALEVNSNVISSTSLGENVINCVAMICTGSGHDDTMIGSLLNEEISGLGGDDIIQGNNGDDIIYGNDGSDSLQGGGGLDNIFGGDGNDYLYADSSTSLSSALAGDQTAIVNRLNDRLLGIETDSFALSNDISTKQNDVADVFASLDGNMLLYSESHLEGGEGNDYLFGGSDNDILSGGPGNDFFDCNEGIDRVLDFNANEDTANVDCEQLN